MNRNYKVVWNRSLGCFTAVAEYAKSQGKSSSGAVSSGANALDVINSNSNALRLSAICAGLAASGLSMQASATYNNFYCIGTTAVTCGYGASADNYGVAIGNVALARGHGATAVGAYSEATDQYASAFGKIAKAKAYASTAIGSQSEALEKYASAVGHKAKAEKFGSTSVGSYSEATADYATALGKVAKATKHGSVAIGAHSITDKDANGVQSAKVGDVTFGGFAGSKDIHAGDQVSFGSAGNERQLKNVAAGNINAHSTDAINGSQLYSVAHELSSATKKPITFAGDTGSNVDRKLGETLKVKGGATNLTDNNIGVVADGHDTLTVKLSKKIDLTQEGHLKIGNTVVNNAGINIAGGPNQNVNLTNNGLNNGGNQITNVKSGGNVDTNAANIGDIKSLTTGLGKTVVKGGTNANVATKVDGNTTTYTVNTDGTKVSSANNDAITVTAGTKDANNVTDYKVDLGQKTKDTLTQVGTNTTNIKNNTTNISNNTNTIAKGFNISAEGKNSDNVKLGETVDFTNDDNNLVVTKTANNTINYDLAKDISVNQVTIGNATNNTVLTSTANGLSVGGDKITNVANGTNDKDAVNLSQLNAAIISGGGSVKYFSVNSTGGGNADNKGATGTNAIAIGKDTTAAGTNTVAIGGGATGQGVNSVAIGNNSVASGQQSIAIGGVQDNLSDSAPTTSSGNQSIAIGANTVSAGNSSIAIGGDDLNDASRTNTNGSTAASALNGGTVNALFKEYSGGKDLVDTSNLYTPAKASGAGAITIGVQSAASGALSTAFGTRAEASGDASSAFGVASKATKKGSVALGAGSTTDGDATSEKSVTINGVKYNFAGSVEDGDTGAQVSVGSKGSERQIKNVASGKISADSTDAINGSQLNATNQSITNVSETVNKGFNITAEGQNKDNVKLGETVDFTNDDNNLVVTKTANNTINYDLAKDISVNQVTIGNATNNTVLTSTADGLSVGGDKITNVASGGNVDTNAANIGDIKSFTAGLGKTVVEGGTNTSVATKVDGNKTTYTVNADGTTVSSADNDALTVTKGTKDANNVTDYQVALGKDTKDSLDKADSSLQSVVTQIDGQNVKTLTKDDNTANFVTGDNIDLTEEAGGVKISVKQNISLASVTTGNSVLNNDGLTITGGPTFTTSQVDVAGNKITNVADGDISKDSKDAINGSQLNTTNTNVTNNTKNITKNAGDITTLQGGFNLESNGADTGAIKAGDTVDIGTANGETNITVSKTGNVVDFALNKDLTVDTVTANSFTAGNSILTNTGLTLGAGNPSITTSGIDAGSKVISNVATGVAGTDAVNVDQLKGITAGIGKTVVAGGTNASVVTEVNGNETTYTVNADGTTVSSADNDALTVTKGTKDANNDTDYQVALGQKTKDTLTQVGTNTTDIAKGFNISAEGKNSDNVKLGETVDFTNDDNNLVVTKTADNTINYDLANDITVGSVTANSFTAGNSILTNTGLTLGAGNPSITTSGIDAGSKVISNVATGVAGTDAVNVDQLTASNETINKGFNIAGANGAADNVKLGETVTYDSTDGSIITTITDNNVDFALGSDLTVGGPGANGQPGKDGTIGVNGADGISGVVLNGKDGSIGLTGADGTNGTITVKDGTPGVDGVDGITRIVIDDTEVATLADGLKFAGNTGDTIAKKLNETLSIEGELADSATASGANLRVDSKDGKLNLVMARDLTELDSVTVGNSVLNTEGLTITGGPTFTTSKVDVAGNKITNVAAGTDDTDAVNVGQLNDTNTQVNKGFNIAGANGAADNVKLGETVTYDSTDGSIITTITDNNVDFALGSDLTVGGPGANGLPGKDGTIGVNGADGISGVVLNGKDGSIGLTGADGTNGTITVKDGTPGVDGKDGITRIVIDDTEVATLADGLKFAGNTGDTIAKKLNETLSIEGELADSATASGANLRVDSKDGKLNLVMARDLTELDSVTVGNSVLNTEGLTITGGPTFTTSKVDVAGNKITNVAAGTDDTDAVNVGQLNDTNTQVNKGFNIAGANGAADNVKLGETVTYDSTDGSIITTITDNNVDFALGSDLTVGGPGANGLPGKDGTIGVNGADGISGVVLNGKDGSIGLTGADGTNGTITVKDGTPGVDGKDGITRIVIDDTEVATLADGLKFAGNTGDTIAKKLNETLSIEGELADSATASGANLRVDSKDGKLNLVMARDLTELDSVTVGNSVLNTEGLTITGGPTFTTSKVDVAGNKITNVAAGTDDTDAVNVGQLNDTNTQVNKGFNIAGANGAADNVKLGETVTYDSTDGSIITTITDNNVDFALGSDLTVGGPGANGLPGKDGTIGVNGADGISGVVLNGKDGSIGLTGADGTNGTITVKDGTPGVDGKDGITRIVIDDTEVATLADGLKFAGNTGDTIAKKLNETLSIEGELADSATASGANLRVDSKDGKLNLVMARDLTELDSVTVGNSVLNTEGLTITVAQPLPPVKWTLLATKSPMLRQAQTTPMR